MSKGRRIREERENGTRKPNGTYWNEIKPGMMMIVPPFWQVQQGRQPIVLPIPPNKRFKGKAMNFHGNRLNTDRGMMR